MYKPIHQSRAHLWLCVPLIVSIVILLACGHWVSPCRASDKKDIPSEIQPDEDVSRVPESIVELQPFRQTRSIMIEGARGEEGLATLTNLNPNINVWYLLQLSWGSGAAAESYHIENPNPRTQRLLLDDSNPYGLIIADGKGRHMCDLWGAKSHNSLKDARGSSATYTASCEEKLAEGSGAAYAPLCGEKLYLLNPTKGHRTKIEMVTDFLRDKVPGGEKIVDLARDTVFKEVYREKAGVKAESKRANGGLAQGEMDNAPASAVLDPKQADRMVKPPDLGIEIQESSTSGMVLGTWYGAKDNPGVYVGVIVPDAIAPEILHSYTKVVNVLDSVEAAGLVYLVAFDLDQFDLKYALGTDHPRVGWSDHMPSQMRNRSLPGPDGIDSIAPLVSTGLISPRDACRTVAAFTGGFKRTHGAFKYGELALKNSSSHYGFIENGIVFSKLQPGLSTIYVLNDGRMDMKTWTERDNSLLPNIEYARQNGVPIIAGFDQATQLSVPGPLVARWGEGNWSGSADVKLRTMRAGAALQEVEGKRFLIYAVFWSATPSVMARVFQAYKCRYAMLLDMNAPEHTYLAVYRREGSNLYTQHLIKGMSGVDMSVKGQYIPRFLGFSDNRDFFYLTRKEAP